MEDVILRQLQDATKAAIAASLDPTLPIKFVEGKWSQPSGTKYIEIVQVQNNPDDMTWNDEKQYAGLYRMLLHWPIEQGGAYEPRALAQSIAEYFGKGRFFGPVKVTQTPNITGPIENPPDKMYAIGVRYEAHQP